jgi:ABC-2 type transport system permease protein
MVFLMPMLLLSGAFFPAEGTHPVLGVLMAVNPLTYGVALLRHALYGASEATAGLPGVGLSAAVTVLFAVGTFWLGTAVVLRRQARDAV